MHCINSIEVGGLRHKDSMIQSSLWYIQAHGFDIPPIPSGHPIK